MNTQRISMYSAIIGSKHYNATLVLPQWNIGELDNIQLVDTARLWDATTLLERAAEDGVNVMFPTAFERSRMCSSVPSETGLESRLPAFAAGEDDTLCVGGGDLFADLWKQDLAAEEVHSQGILAWHKALMNSEHFTAARKWLQPTQQITKMAHHIVRTLLTSRERFYAVHLCTEDGVANACAGQAPSTFDVRPDDLKCMLGMQNIAEQLQLQGVTPGSFLYVFPWQADKVGVLCQDAYQCIHRGSADVDHDLHYNEKALLDLAVAMESDGVFGNICSPTSIELVASMQARGKRAAFLNTVCSREPSEEST